ncbi:hypothetical protein PCASD_04415 [Puccinia coronata f. sp. avenae]|uniref:Uncharacterized protein n=1 Tax=Puccinia coronata f. sp. avenae TaxID=200324 RepID=A0A2N5VBS7_9BASI|nr:hypothetical protein PCASD_04415 [Puccinia coronata f. sp. avenae]
MRQLTIVLRPSGTHSQSRPEGQLPARFHTKIMNRIVLTLLPATFAIASLIPSLSGGLITGETLSCTHYAQANTQSATCGEGPNVVCSQKCVGGVVVDGCSSAQETSGPLSRQTCTIGFSQTSATKSICFNGQGSFTCTGIPTGQATCSGCMNSQLQSATLQPVSAVSALGGSTAPVVPAIAASPNAATAIVSQNTTLNATAVKDSPKPATPPTAVAPAPALSTQIVTVIAEPANNDNTTSVAAAGQDQYFDNGNTTSIASINYLKDSAQLLVTIGLMAAVVINV